MIDKRDWLISKGLAKPGRGRFSRAALEALAQAERDGVAFLDKSVVTGVVNSVNEKGELVEEVKQIDPFAHHPPALREGQLPFHGENGFTLMVSASEGCANCRYSFGWCKCITPQFRYWKTGEVLSLGEGL